MRASYHASIRAEEQIGPLCSRIVLSPRSVFQMFCLKHRLLKPTGKPWHVESQTAVVQTLPPCSEHRRTVLDVLYINKLRSVIIWTIAQPSTFCSRRSQPLECTTNALCTRRWEAAFSVLQAWVIRTLLLCADDSLL